MSILSHARRAFLALVGLAAAGITACVNQVSGNERRRRGPVGAVADAALEHGNLSDEQADAVIAIAERARGEREHKRAFKRRMRDAGARVLRSGVAGDEDFADAMADATATAERYLSQNADALLEIHALLDGDQRATVAEALRERIAARQARKRDWAARRRDRFARLGEYLSLDAGQTEALSSIKQQVHQSKRQLKPGGEELAALADAFAGDAFGEAVAETRDGRLRLLDGALSDARDHVGGVLSTLDDAQRHKLADLLEHGPEAVGLRWRSRRAA